MLKVARLRQPTDKRALFQSFRPDEDVWVVSDLRTKLELQKELMSERPGLPGDAILRGSELWTQLLKKHFPKATVISKDWMQLFARTALGNALSPSDLNVAVELTSVLGSVFAHPDRDVFLEDLLARDPSAATRWGKVLPEAQLLFDQARSRGWILQEALASVLTNVEDPRLRHPLPGRGRLFFDLGASLGASEAEIIRRLARVHDVVVLLPRPAHAENFRFLLQPGESLDGEDLPVPESEATSCVRSYPRFSGRVAELKNAVAQVREWLDDGVAIERIGVITPNFEMDFPVLATAFRVEGIPLDREPSERVQTHRLLQKWSAKLRLWKEELDFADLLTAFQEDLPVRSEEFAAKLRTGLFHEDLARIAAVRDRVEEWRQAGRGDVTDLGGFFESATSLWVDPDFTDLEQIFESLNEKTPRGARLSMRDWIEWMEVQTARLEMTKARGGADRLAVVPLQSADSLAWTHRIFLSMTDQLPERGATSLLNRDEIDTLGWTHGFFLPHPEQKLLQFELEWSLLAHSEIDILSYPLTDWDGAPTSPQALWLAGRGNAGHEADAPKTTRWDELQGARLHESQPVEKGAVPVPQTKDLRLSASSLQRYGDCPFIFASEKIFGLIDPPLVDLDLDRRQLGQLQHAYLEALTEGQPPRFERSEDELGAILDALVVAEGDSAPATDPRLWQAQRTKWIRWGQRFLAVEKAWFESHPGTRIIARELSFQFIFDPAAGTWRRGERQAPHEIEFTGRLDRVDGYFENGVLKSVLLYDYKASLSGKHAFSAWLRDNEIQLGFYSWAMNEGLIDPDWAGKVGGALYYNLRTLERDRGVVVAESVGTLADRSRPKGTSAADLADFWNELMTDVRARMDRIVAGQIAPAPLDEKLCVHCAWKGLCRAPHLM